MNELLKRAVETVRLLPDEEQAEIARVMLSLAGDDRPPEDIDPAHLTDVLEGLEQARRREFSSEAEVKAAFRALPPISGTSPAI